MHDPRCDASPPITRHFIPLKNRIYLVLSIPSISLHPQALHGPRIIVIDDLPIRQMIPWAVLAKA